MNLRGGSDTPLTYLSAKCHLDTVARTVSLQNRIAA